MYQDSGNCAVRFVILPLMVVGLLAALAGCPPAQYVLTVNVTGQGTIVCAPLGGTYDAGTLVTLTPAPSAGWHFDHWEDGLTGNANPGQVTMDAAKTVTAVFAIDRFGLTVSVTGEGGVALSPDGGTYDAGTVVTLTPAPSAGWHFDHWEDGLTGNANPEQVTMDSAKTVLAVFAPDGFTLDVNITGGGTVTLDPSGGVYSAGTLVGLTVTANAGWHFDRWEGALTGSATSTQITMDADKTVTAVFERDQYTLTVSSEGGGSVTLDPPGGVYPSETVVTLIPNPNVDSRFEAWDGNLRGTKQPATITMDGNKNVYAMFMPKLLTNLQPSNLCAVGSTLYFLGNGLYSGRELWKSDGTFEGTTLVKDLVPGNNGAIYYLVNLNGVLYFLAEWTDDSYGYGLWKSDGTEDGTVMVADLGNSFFAMPPVKVGDRIFWGATDTQGGGGELWSSDGTAGGTGIVKSFGISGTPGQLTDVGGVLYFDNSMEPDTFTLWKSDGTEAGTLPLYTAHWINGIAGLNGQAYFSAGATEYSLFTTDGTEAGTHKMYDFFTGPGNYTVSGGLLYFTAQSWASPILNSLVWASNGTDVYTVDAGPYRPWDLFDFNGTLLFEALYDVNSVTHCGLFATTGSGATLLRQINPTLFYGLTSYQVIVGDVVYFVAENSVGGAGLWKTDGTEAGTVPVSDINPTGLGPYYLTNVNGTLFFAGQDDAYGYQLWTSDGTLAGTLPISCPTP